MAYKIVSKPRAWWPIRFKGVLDDGTVVENEIRGRFIVLDEDEFKKFEDEMRPALLGETDPEKSASAISSPFIMRILEDWEGVLEDDGTEAGRSLPFNQENLERMLRVPNFGAGVAGAFREVRNAEPDRRKGN